MLDSLELQILLGYSKWENFEKVIRKAKDACQNAGELIENHFPDSGKWSGLVQTLKDP